MAENSETKTGWVQQVRDYVAALPRVDFTLSELYEGMPHFTALHPDSSSQRSCIRCALQKLRDLGEIAFLERGHYRKTPSPDDPTADKIYIITVEEILSAACQVQAKTEAEALEIARRRYWEGRLTLESGNLLNVRFRASLFTAKKENTEEHSSQ